MTVSATTSAKLKFPHQIKYIVANEAAERYSYYGMRSILVVFMVQYLLFAETKAVSIYHYFISANYLCTFIGGYLADRYWGKYKTIIRLSIVYCLGHLVLALWENEMGLYWGLGLIAFGAGGIKPCASAHAGDQIGKGKEALIAKLFDLWYWMINLGAFASTALTPITLPKFGPKVAFGIPGVLMAIATFIFWLGRKYFVHVPPSGKNPHSPSKIIFTALKNLKNKKKGEHFLDCALPFHPKEQIEGVKSVLDVSKPFLLISIFWALFEQHGSSWVIQAQKMDLHVFGFELLPSQVAALNPILILSLVPVFNIFIYPAFTRMGFNVTPLNKMKFGMFITSLSFAAVTIAQYMLDHGQAVSIGWQALGHSFLAVGEILISISGLEFAYTQAPRALKSMVMSLWFLTVVIGNMFTGIIAQLNVFGEGWQFFNFFAMMMFGLSFVFLWAVKDYKVRSYIEGT
ncbi:MAG: MFS transporter [Bacteriovoracaceae bacterium]|nr:MFS transporter [Bacteriovoracaceae bacterium]